MNKKIIISPWSRPLRNGGFNPKNPPVFYWLEIIEGLKQQNYYIIQIGIDGEIKLEGVDEYKFNLNFKELENLTLSVDTFLAVDNFYQHFCWLHNKPGFVIFAQSDPNIFGHSTNTNLLKDRKYLRIDQFNIWESCSYDYNAFIESEKVLLEIYSKK